jgi:hypothetical protein
LESGLPFTIETYRGIPLFESEQLVRYATGGDGVGSGGYVYETYILAPGTIGFGWKPQVAQVGEVASLLIDLSQYSTNNVTVYDRYRFLLHLNGMKWTGTPSGQSATDAELATTTNWSLQFQTANRVGGVLIRTNG